MKYFFLGARHSQNKFDNVINRKKGDKNINTGKRERKEICNKIMVIIEMIYSFLSN